MRPNIQKITINENLDKIKIFIQEVILRPKRTLKKWSVITRQTPSFKLGYLGQHLASLITGVQGSGSGARGDDLCDGTEVKSCNKIDQLDKCEDCGGRVLRYEETCPICGSRNIERKNDSKWLFSVRSYQELEIYKNLDRILLLLMDYPDFDKNNFNDIRISAFEIYPRDPRCKVFNNLIDFHYNHIYLPKIRKKGKANPMNLHPFSFQFYKCNPTLIFQCIIRDINKSRKDNIEILHYKLPHEERKGSILMPSTLLKSNEWGYLNLKKIMEKYKLKMDIEEFTKLSAKNKAEVVAFLDEEDREHIPLREINSSEQISPYRRQSE